MRDSVRKYLLFAAIGLIAAVMACSDATDSVDADPTRPVGETTRPDSTQETSPTVSSQPTATATSTQAGQGGRPDDVSTPTSVVDATAPSQPGAQIIPGTFDGLLVGFGPEIGTPKALVEWRQAYINATTTAAELMILTASALQIDAGSTDFEDYKQRLAMALASSERAVRYANVLESTSKTLMDGLDEQSNGDVARDLTSLLIREKPIVPLNQPTATSSDIRNQLRAAYNDPKTLNHTVKLARQLGFSARFISLQLSALEGSAQASAYNDESATHRTLESTARVIRTGAGLIVFVAGAEVALPVIAQTSGAAFAFESGSLMLGASSIMSSFVEDVAFVAFGDDNVEIPPIVSGIKDSNEIVSLVNFGRGLTDVNAAATNLMWLGGIAERGLQRFLSTADTTRINAPTSLESPLLEIEVLAPGEFTEAAGFSDTTQPQPPLLPGNYRAENGGSIVVDTSSSAVREVTDTAPDAFPPLSNSDLNAGEEFEYAQIPSFELPSYLEVRSVREVPELDRIAFELVNRTERGVRFPQMSVRYTAADGSTRSQNVSTSAHSGGFANTIIPGESIVASAPAALPGEVMTFIAATRRVSGVANPFADDLVLERGVLSIADHMMKFEANGDLSVHARIGRLVGDKDPINVVVTLYDDEDRAIWEGKAGIFGASTGGNFPPEAGHSGFVRLVIPAQIKDLVSAYRITAFEPFITLVNGEWIVSDVVGWTLAEGEGVSIPEVTISYHGAVQTPYWLVDGNPYVGLDSFEVARHFGEITNNSPFAVKVERILATYDGAGEVKSNSFLPVRILEPGQTVPFSVPYLEFQHQQIIDPDYDHHVADQPLPPLPAPKLEILTSGKPFVEATIERGIDRELLSVSVQKSLDGSIELTGHAIGTFLPRWDIEVTNLASFEIDPDIYVQTVAGAVTTSVKQKPSTSAKYAPGETRTELIDSRVATVATDARLNWWPSGFCNSCPENLPEDRGPTYGPVGQLVIDPDEFCDGLQTEAGLEICKAFVVNVVNGGIEDALRQGPVGAKCEDLSGPDRNLCKVMKAAHSGDPSGIAELGQDAIVQYIALSGDRSLLDLIEDDEAHDGALVLSISFGISDPAKLPERDICERLRIPSDSIGLDDLNSVCETVVATVLAIDSQDPSECDVLLERLPQHNQYPDLDPEFEFEGQFDCQRSYADAQTLSERIDRLL